MPVPPFTAALGARLAELRSDTGHTQEDVATVARALGLPWHRSAVARFEGGERALTAEELILLPLILTRATGRPVTFADLFDSPQRVGVGALSPVPLAAVPDVLLGANVAETAQAETHTAPRPGEAEEKAARRLGITAAELAAAAHDLYGHSMTAERDRRALTADPDAAGRRLQALRGAASRTLLDELRDHLRTERE